MHLTALLLTLDAVIAVPTDYVVDKKPPINLLINTSIPLLPSASRYYAELLVAVAGRFPPRRTEDLCASGQTRQRSPPYTYSSWAPAIRAPAGSRNCYRDSV